MIDNELLNGYEFVSMIKISIRWWNPKNHNRVGVIKTHTIMNEKFQISQEALAKLETIQSKLAKSASKDEKVISANSCTCCWGGWCANGCTG